MKDFSVKLELRIDWVELDLFGHVNNVAISKYVQSARVNYLEHIGLMQLFAEAKIGPVLASTNCQFRKSLLYPGHVTIYSKVDAVKNTSLSMRHVICDEANDIIAEAKDIIVLFDFHNNTKLIIPDELRENIKKLENKTVC